jgi:hypothetical protein
MKNTTRISIPIPINAKTAYSENPMTNDTPHDVEKKKPTPPPTPTSNQQQVRIDHEE